MLGKNINFLLIAFLTLYLTCSCTDGKKGRLPASIGQPYEVVLEGDTENIVEDILTKEVPALPQAEPLCNLIKVKRGQSKGSYLLVKTRIIVDTNKKFAVKLSHDENATPQNIIRITASSSEELRKRLNGEKLRLLIDSLEKQHLVSVIQQNPEKQKLVKKRFGISMKVPASIDAQKEGKDFLWLSNNAARGMQNLLFFHANTQQQVDSILRKNMLGETDQMYMTIPHLAERGLWEMKGDAMGGPYVMKRKGSLIVIGFVYAPEMNKRNLMKQLEAVLTTIK